MVRRIGIIGGGAWGTALAATAQRAGREVCLWALEPDVVAAINSRHENTLFLPNIRLDPAIRATEKPSEAVEGADALLLVTPAQHLRSVTEKLAPHVAEERPLVVCAKGIEMKSGRLMTEVLEESLPHRPLAVLSGPTFAAEVAVGLPTAVTLAARDQALGEELVLALGSREFRPYLSDDPIGAQIGGAVKNVIAIACGLVAGKQLGKNARAALITRGLAEMVRLGLAKGGQADTLMGLSGLGDLTLTCTATASRNYSLGVALGEKRRLHDVLAERRSVAEGVASAAAVVDLAARYGVEVPICAAVHAVLNEGASLDAAIHGLLSRPFKPERPNAPPLSIN